MKPKIGDLLVYFGVLNRLEYCYINQIEKRTNETICYGWESKNKTQAKRIFKVKERISPYGYMWSDDGSSSKWMVIIPKEKASNQGYVDSVVTAARL